MNFIQEEHARRLPSWFGPRHLRVLARIARLRIITPAQARWLVGDYDGLCQSAVEKNLGRLAKHQFLKAELVEPRSGAVSAIFYRLTWRAGYLLSADPARMLFARPVQHILRYLLFRNTVYAQARADGWRLASPIYSSPTSLPGVSPDLQRVGSQGPPRGSGHASGRIAGTTSTGFARKRPLPGSSCSSPRSSPSSSCSSCTGARRRATDVVLLIIDDPRRAIYGAPVYPGTKALKELKAARSAAQGSGPSKPRRVVPPRPGPQWDDLPNVNPPGLRLLLRDSSTHFDLVKRETLPREQPAPHLA